MHCFRECLQSVQVPHLEGAAERLSLRWTREALDVEGGTAPLHRKDLSATFGLQWVEREQGSVKGRMTTHQ